jgi:hypothetical protein
MMPSSHSVWIKVALESIPDSIVLVNGGRSAWMDWV